MAGRPHIVALIVAAGSGTRAGEGVPKQYRALDGRPVLAHAIDPLAGHPAIDAIQVVIGADQEELYRDAVGERPLLPPVTGGCERRESARNGLEAIAQAGGADVVVIHDAARPFCPPDVIDRLLAALGDHDGAVPALPVADTLARADGGLGDTVAR
ncbi:MAG: 2-C-methyl-D-erythritol 4-phosphate cytidylyltransferase, partial [Sphingomonadaceae bacterium]|nr:2-C-methyl-D-erythritol 4-phosphate cytidylyltransferase [Sphingomonadaceae bacterium]